MIWRAVAIIVAAYLLSLPVAAQEIPLRNGLSLAYGSPAAPALSLDGVDERRHTLEALRGQVVVVNFWATWCPPCIAEMPAMQRMYELLHEDGLEVLAINAGQDAETIGAFLSEFEVALTFPVLLDPKGRRSRPGAHGACPRPTSSTRPATSPTSPRGAGRWIPSTSSRCCARSSSVRFRSSLRWS